MDAIRKAFQGIDEKDLEAAIAAATKKVKPAKVDKFERTGVGRYNGITLPVCPHTVVKAIDAGKPTLKWRWEGQQIIAIDRNFVPPVIVEYVTDIESFKWVAAMISAIAKELAKEIAK